MICHWAPSPSALKRVVILTEAPDGPQTPDASCKRIRHERHNLLTCVLIERLQFRDSPTKKF